MSINIPISNNQLQSYVNNLINIINDIPDCQSLNELELKAIAQLESILSKAIAIRAQLLINSIPPVDLVTTIVWITNWINQNVLIPLEQVIALEQLLIQDIARLETAISNKYANLHCTFVPLNGIQFNVGVTGGQITGGATIGGGGVL